MKNTPLDDVGLMQKLVREAYWRIAYHEEKISQTHKQIAVVKALLIRTGIAMTDEQAIAIYDDGNSDADLITNVDDFARHILGEALHQVTYHDKELRDAHADLAALKIIAQRGGYDRGGYDIDFDGINAQQRKRLAEQS